MAVCIDKTEEAIVEACIACAKKEGITDLYMLDRQFVIDALREKKARDDAVKIKSGKKVDVAQAAKIALGKIEDAFVEALQECRTEEEVVGAMYALNNGMESAMERAVERGLVNFGKEGEEK